MRGKKNKVYNYVEHLIEEKDILTDLTVLIGHNGSGKTQSLRELEHSLRLKGKEVIVFGSKKDDSLSKLNLSTNQQGGDIIMSKMMTAFESEGERINSSFNYWIMETLFPYFKKWRVKGTGNDCWLLLDEIDSGLSWDRIKLLVDQLTTIQNMEKEKEGNTLKIVTTSNSYELTSILKGKGARIWSIPLNKDVTDEINTYEDFVQLYLENYKKLQG